MRVVNMITIENVNFSAGIRMRGAELGLKAKAWHSQRFPPGKRSLHQIPLFQGCRDRLPEGKR